MDTSTPDFLTLPDRRLAYQLQRGDASKPGLIFLGGFGSDMQGTKACFLAERCAEAGITLLRFDYRGHGQSSGDFKDGTIGDWFEDTCCIFDKLAEGPQILIGSSMGGWLALLLAMKYPQRIHALIGVAAAPDFTEDLLMPAMTALERARLQWQGSVMMKSLPPDPPILITRRLIEEGRDHLVLRGRIEIPCPVRLLQGMLDLEVPWGYVFKIVEAIKHNDILVTTVKNGDHRLSRPEDLDLLWRMVREFI